MSDGLVRALIIVAAAGSGVVGGIWFTFSTFVMKALARLPAEHAIAAMQSINVVVLNSIFFLAFFGTGAVSAALAIVALLQWSASSVALLAGSFLYLVAAIGVTGFGNVPLNNALAGADAGSADAEALWSRYLVDWTRWNHVRTVGTVAAAVAFMIALI